MYYRGSKRENMKCYLEKRISKPANSVKNCLTVADRYDCVMYYRGSKRENMKCYLAFEVKLIQTFSYECTVIKWFNHITFAFLLIKCLKFQFV